MSSVNLQADWLRRHWPSTALYLAVDRNSPFASEALFLALLERPGLMAGTAAKDEYGRPLLHCACAAGYSHAVSRVLELKMDPNEVSELGVAPLLEAAAGGHGSVVQVLCHAEGIDAELPNTVLVLYHPA